MIWEGKIWCEGFFGFLTKMIWEGKLWCEGFLVSSSSRKKVWCRLASDLLRLFIRTFRGATRHAEECLTNMFMFCILVHPQHELLFVLLLVQIVLYMFCLVISCVCVCGCCHLQLVADIARIRDAPPPLESVVLPYYYSNYPRSKG